MVARSSSDAWQHNPQTLHPLLHHSSEGWNPVAAARQAKTHRMIGSVAQATLDPSLCWNDERRRRPTCCQFGCLTSCDREMAGGDNTSRFSGPCDRACDTPILGVGPSVFPRFRTNCALACKVSGSGTHCAGRADSSRWSTVDSHSCQTLVDAGLVSFWLRGGLTLSGRQGPSSMGFK